MILMVAMFLKIRLAAVYFINTRNTSYSEALQPFSYKGRNSTNFKKRE
jgi:hypothetical protein